eukprot:748103_1
MNMNANRNDSRNIYNSSNENGNNSRGRGGSSGNNASSASQQLKVQNNIAKSNGSSIIPPRLRHQPSPPLTPGQQRISFQEQQQQWLVVDTCTIYHSVVPLYFAVELVPGACFLSIARKVKMSIK